VATDLAARRSQRSVIESATGACAIIYASLDGPPLAVTGEFQMYEVKPQTILRAIVQLHPAH
jgi:hypothetical protein